MNNVMTSVYFCNKIQQQKLFISSHWTSKCSKYNLCLEQQMTIKWKVGRAVSFSENALNENRQNMKNMWFFVFSAVKQNMTY